VTLLEGQPLGDLEGRLIQQSGIDNLGPARVVDLEMILKAIGPAVEVHLGRLRDQRGVIRGLGIVDRRNQDGRIGFQRRSVGGVARRSNGLTGRRQGGGRLMTARERQA